MAKKYSFEELPKETQIAERLWQIATENPESCKALLDLIGKESFIRVSRAHQNFVMGKKLGVIV